MAPSASRKAVSVTPPAPKKGRNWLLWGLLACGAFLGLAFVAALGLVAWKAFGNGTPKLAIGERIGVLRLEGPIYDGEAERLIQILDGYQDEAGVKGVLIRINSGGGTVAASEELYSKIQAVSKEKPVLSYIAEAGASGAYYAACGSDEIIANPGAITGSIGVIMEFWQAESLLQKVGVKFEVIKSGAVKDAGSMARGLTVEERKLFQGTIDDVYEMFLSVVLESRSASIKKALADRDDVKEDKISKAQIRSHLKSLADGRIMTGNQAYSQGLVDDVGTYEEAQARITEMAKIKGKARFVEEGKPGTLDKIFESASRVANPLVLAYKTKF